MVRGSRTALDLSAGVRTFDDDLISVGRAARERESGGRSDGRG